MKQVSPVQGQGNTEHDSDGTGWGYSLWEMVGLAVLVYAVPNPFLDHVCLNESMQNSTRDIAETGPS